jgi:8-oxo-dGTP pyrophosphatase MutT (NUDIX family)/GNAT superfamily N-acetyltransferase
MKWIVFPGEVALTKLRALVTAGGTREQVDDVRVLTNVSRGRFGTSIARALAARGVETTLLGSRELVRSPELEQAPFARDEFSSFADLRSKLERLGDPALRPDIIFMAAAVSDYSPVPHEGKISSDREELTINLKRNPKLLAALRSRCGPATFIVGFKLLSRVSRDELVRVATKQVKDNGLDLTVANDLARLGEVVHPVVLVTPDGNATDIEGPRDEVAARIVEHVLGRLNVPPATPQDLVGPVEGVESVQRLEPSLAIPDATAPIADRGEIVAALARSSLDGTWEGGPFLVEIGSGALLLGLEKGGPERIEREWSAARTALLRDVPEAANLALSKVFVGSHVAGVLARSAEHDSVSLYLTPEHRGRGEGDALVRRLSARGDTVAVQDASPLLDYYKERGYRPIKKDGPLALLEPPTRRKDVSPAASVCLFDPVGRRVLVGRRLVGSAHRDFWAFPGGRAEAGESPLACALRELREETGIEACGRPLLETVHHVGTPDRAFEVTNFVIPVLALAPPKKTDELDAVWLPLDEAVLRRPMVVGAKRVLHRLRTLH